MTHHNGTQNNINNSTLSITNKNITHSATALSIKCCLCLASRFGEYRFTQCRYVECRHAKCRGVTLKTEQKVLIKLRTDQ